MTNPNDILVHCQSPQEMLSAKSFLVQGMFYGGFAIGVCMNCAANISFRIWGTIMHTLCSRCEYPMDPNRGKEDPCG
jgi:hypothetical protein